MGERAEENPEKYIANLKKQHKIFEDFKFFIQNFAKKGIHKFYRGSSFLLQDGPRSTGFARWPARLVRTSQQRPRGSALPVAKTRPPLGAGRAKVGTPKPTLFAVLGMNFPWGICVSLFWQNDPIPRGSLGFPAT